MTKTKYYDLQMDDPQDDYDVEVVNANLKKIDEQMKTRENATDALQEPEFTVADKRENIASKEKMPKILGKIAKFFTDLKTVAFSGKYSDLDGKPAIVNNNTTTEPGSALDARQANPNIEGTMAANIQQINSNLSDLSGSLGNLKVLTCDSFEALDTELSNMLTNTPYIAVIPGGDGMLFGLKNHSDYQRQLRMTYWDNVLYSRVKTNSTKWSEWVNVNDITKFINIPSNANLNDIKFFNVGKYRCYSNVTAETVLNSPFNTAFTMEVYYSAGTSNYVAQKATEFATGHCKWRMRETGSGKLQDWVQLY